MSITFGAVGDIISVALLAKDLLATLDEARGSKAEYRDVVQAINNLNEIIDTVNTYVIQPGLITPELCTLCETSKQAVARCHDLGSAFLARIGRYQTAFDKTHGTNKLKEVTMAVRWRIGEKEALVEFYAEVVRATSSLQTLLAIANFALLNVNRKEMNDKLDGARLKDDITITSRNAALNDIKDGMRTANMNIEAGNSMLTKVSEALKFDWIRQLGSEIKGKMQSVMVINFAIYDAIIRLQETLPRYLERGISEELITLEDPISRVAPFSLQWITSWDAFHSALELRFQDMPGQNKMRRRQYALQASGTGREIELSRPWHAAFRPGQRIEMSFIFNQDAAGESNSTTCPGCHTQSKYSSDAEIECMKCQIRFRRITAIQDNELPLRATASSKNLPKKGPMVPLKAVITAEQEQEQDQASYGDAEHEEEDITSFKRVRIVSNRKCVRKYGNISPDKALPKRSIDPRGLTNDHLEKMFGPLNGRSTDLRAQVDQFHEQVGRRAGEQGPKYAPGRLNIVRTVIRNMKERDRLKAKLANETTPTTQRELERWRELNSASAAPHIDQTIHLGNHDQESKRRDQSNKC